MAVVSYRKDLKQYNNKNMDDFKQSIEQAQALVNEAITQDPRRAFPEMDFQKIGGKWCSRYKLHGHEPTNKERKGKNKTNIYNGQIKEWGEHSISFVDYQKENNGHDRNEKGIVYIQALKDLCRAYGIQEPTPDPETAEKIRLQEQQKRQLEEIDSRMRRNLRSGEDFPNKVLSYLKNVRGYDHLEKDLDGNDVDIIEAIGFGFVSKDDVSDLRNTLGRNWKGHQDIAGNNALAVSCKVDGRIVGYNFRAFDEHYNHKYLYSFRSKDDKDKGLADYCKGDFLFSSKPLSTDKGTDITLVEGQIDEKHISALGIPNVANMGSNSLNEEQARKLYNRGFKSITLIPDIEPQKEDPKEEEEKQKKKSNDILSIISTAEKAGLKAYVAELPPMFNEDGKRIKCDVDSFLVSHPITELKEIIDNAKPGILFRFCEIVRKAAKQQASKDGLTYKDVAIYKADVLKLIAEDPEGEYVGVIRREYDGIFGKDYGPVITDQEIKRMVDEARQLKEEQAYKERITTAVEDIKEHLQGADSWSVEKIESHLEKALKEAAAEKKLTKYKDLLEIPSDSENRKQMGFSGEFIPTDYEVCLSKQLKRRLMVPSGAITLVGAPTSHGKSTFLRNLALQFAQKRQINGKEWKGSVLYFSLEESRGAVLNQMVNTYCNLDLTTNYYGDRGFNNLTSIQEYYKTGTTEYMKESSVNDFKAKSEIFIKEYIDSGKLRVYNEDYNTDELLEALRTICGSIETKAIFVDYVQLLRMTGKRNQSRADELKEVCNELMKFAIEIKKPVILAAQLNRETKSPLDLNNQNMAEASDLEKSANSVFLLWNSDFPSRDNDNRTIKGLLDLSNNLKSSTGKPFLLKGLDNPDPNKREMEGTRVYLKVTKQRGDQAGFEGVFDFNGNTGRIEPNFGEYEEELKPIQTELPF